MNHIHTLVEEIHSASVATIGYDGYPEIRTIDLMLYDEKGIYFLTAKGKAFYQQLKEQNFIALSAVKDQKSVSLRGKVRSIGSEKLEEIFEKNSYMQKIYPEGTRDALEVFVLYEAQGQYFDISDPSHIFREPIIIGNAVSVSSYRVQTESCTGCGNCLSVCPQNCIRLQEGKALIDHSHCLHCGRCIRACTFHAITGGTR